MDFANALYHVTSRGDWREAIFEDGNDRRNFLQTLGQVVGNSTGFVMSGA